ncbi:hypothetical protein J2X69_004715, partial [Algoriphagus sp. 4150]|uniref:hypothetical protein n=1 Tax=Algoriphagus sp. 4150 TaxID=2817756 RepID=UPI0028653ADC
RFIRLISTKMVDAGIYNHAPVCRAPVMDISSDYFLIFKGQIAGSVRRGGSGESRMAYNHPDV